MRILSCLAAGLVLASPAALAADPKTKIPATPRAEIAFTASTKRAFDRSGKYVTEAKRPDGSTQVSLNGSFQNVTVARIGPDGTIETFCTTDQEQAKDFMAREGAFADAPSPSSTLSGDVR